MAITHDAFILQIHQHNPITITNKIRLHLKTNPLPTKTPHLPLKFIDRPINPFIHNIIIQSTLSNK